ncbi:hypothetical protein AQUCO_03700165v1 [Aquilegia coerulea]|uniref:Nucleoside diphosphate kinase n=1 Tax=Aquilegia coerulea TaxID=218851 RepID=A0A2G5CTV4_AQUCA|nr:hypothetical protein AQUCO_03700165v1 [Aquilegia coerulea]
MAFRIACPSCSSLHAPGAGASCCRGTLTTDLQSMVLICVTSCICVFSHVSLTSFCTFTFFQFERTFIAIKPDGVQRGLISEIMSRFERKGFKLVAVKLVVPSKDFAQKHYHDLKERPFFNGLCDFLSSGPVLAMVWEGEGVIKYGRKLIGATDPQKSEPGTIRGDLAVVVGRNIIHGSDGPETAKDEINLWFKPEELVSYQSNSEKWVYGNN